MSSRKRKKRGKQGAAELQGSETESADVPEAESGSEKPAAEGGEVDVEEEPAAPAVSEISELKPRRKRRRKGDAEEAEPEETPAAEAEPEQFAEVGGDDEDEDEEAFGDDAAKEAPKTRAQLKRVLESLIFVSDQVITAVQLGRIVKTKVGEVREALAEMSVDYEGRGIELVEVNGGYQFRSAAASGPYVRALVAQRPVRLTRAQLETLALIAYRQPITRPEVDDVRGVDSGSAIKVLLDRELIKILGRKEDAGRPLLYGTTPFFLEFFGMNTMQELPTLREFTELSDEHQELFKRKTNEIGDLSAEAEMPVSVARADTESTFERWDDEGAVDGEHAQPVAGDDGDVEGSVASGEECDSAEVRAEGDDYAESDEGEVVDAHEESDSDADDSDERDADADDSDESDADADSDVDADSDADADSDDDDEEGEGDADDDVDDD